MLIKYIIEFPPCTQVAATSRPDLLDPALLRSGRIDRLVHCSFPDSTARLNLFKSLAKLSSLNFCKDVDLNAFCGSKYPKNQNKNTKNETKVSHFAGKFTLTFFSSYK